jgi:hypothetical protein
MLMYHLDINGANVEGALLLPQPAKIGAEPVKSLATSPESAT